MATSDAPGTDAGTGTGLDDYAAAAGLGSAVTARLYNKKVTDAELWRGVESGGGVHPALPGADSIMHGIGTLSLSKYLMEPDTFPLNHVQDAAGVEVDYPDAWKPVVGVGVVGIGGGILLKEGHMEAGVHNLETAGRFLEDVATYSTGPETGIDHDDYWDAVMDTAPTAAYCQLRGYNTALREAVTDRMAGIYDRLRGAATEA